MPSPDLRLGVDVGGTNTDAVVLDADDRLLAKAKVPTTPDVTKGIEDALAGVVEQVDRARITHAMFGTTHATNAVLQRRGLRRVGVLRLGGPATQAIRPLFGWPADLRDGDLGRGADRRRRDRVRRAGAVAARPRRDRALRRRGGGARGGDRDHERLRAGLGRARAHGRGDRPQGARRRADLAQLPDRLPRPARARERHRPERVAHRRRARRDERDRRRPRTPRPAARHVLRAERRHAHGSGVRDPLPRAHDRQRPREQHPGRGLPHRPDRRDRGRRRRDLDRRGRARSGLPARVLVRRRDRRDPDELPDARSRDDRARRGNDRDRGRARPRERRVPDPRGGARVRGNDADAHRRGRRRATVRPRRREPPRPARAAPRRRHRPLRRRAGGRDRSGEDVARASDARRRRRRCAARAR